MIQIKYHISGTPPATLISHVESDGKPSVITLIQYDNETIFEGQVENFDELMRRFDPSLVNWINVDGLSDLELLRKLGRQFNIHPLALEDVLNTTQRPKVENYADHYFIISEMIYKGDPDFSSGLLRPYRTNHRYSGELSRSLRWSYGRLSVEP